MSISLRDAQHVSWKTFRKINDALKPEKSNEWTPLTVVTDLANETSNIVSTIKESEASKSSEESKAKDTLATELADALYMIFVLAEHYGIELEETFMQTVNDRMISMLR